MTLTYDMKQGYTEIPNTNTILQSDNDNNDDHNSSINNTSTTSKIIKKHKVIIIIIAAAALLSALVVYHGNLSSHPSKDNVKNISPSTRSSDDTSTASICTYYINSNLKLTDPIKNVSFIQSSFASSKFWEEIVCNSNDEIDDKRQQKTKDVDNLEAEAVIYVDWDGDISAKILKDFDPILGFGGAFTEASSFNFKSLSKNGQDDVLQLLFGKDGLGYALGRVPLNSCDYSISSYNFDNVEDDFDLVFFDENVTRDVQNGMIEMITRANDIYRMSWNDDKDGHLKLIASPWSPPAWMKAPVKNVDMDNATHATFMDQTSFPVGLRNGTGIDSKYAKSWAKYISKFLYSYKNNHGIQFFAVTVQNEPAYPAPWEACAYDKASQKEFIQYHLGPILQHDHPHVKLFAYDFNKDNAADWAQYLLLNGTSSSSREETAVSKYIDGFAIHWYGNTIDRQLDGKVGAPNMHKLKQTLTSSSKNSDRFLIGTEACNCPSTGYNIQNKKLLFERAERYAHSILSDLAAGSQGWMEWNLILNSKGGPNHLNNYCDASLLAMPNLADAYDNNGNASNRDDDHVDTNSIYPKEYLKHNIIVQPMYYFLGHISRYVRPGSKSLMSIVDNNIRSTDDSSYSEKEKIRTFRPHGQSKPGGGQNYNARVGIEITTWPCEGSTRQSWNFDVENGRLFVIEEKPLDFEGEEDSIKSGTKLCLSNKADLSYSGILLTQCDSTSAAVLKMKYVNHDKRDTHTKIKFQLLNDNNVDADDLCLDILPLANKGGSYGERGGMQTDYRDCENSVFWNYDFHTGEVTTYDIASFEKNDRITSSIFSASTGFKESCLTTGYPFLQVGFFDTSSTKNNKDERVLVVLNEAHETAKFHVKTGSYSNYFHATKSTKKYNENVSILKNSIPPHSIQTYIF